MTATMKRIFVAAIALAASAQAHAAPQIRFCPAAQVRTYPEENHRNISGLLLQNVAIVNNDQTPFEVKAITIELLRGDEVVDTRRMTGDDVAHNAAQGKAVQAAGMIAAVPFQFCGQDLIADGVKLGGPTLSRGEALLVAQQAFVFNGVRDTLRVRVAGAVGGRPAEVSNTLPIRSDFSKIAYRFPLHGVWYAGNGPTFYTAHRWALPEEFAFDIVRLGAGGLSHSGDGSRFSDYYDYGANVMAAADGRVAVAHDGEPEDATAMRQPGETQQSYFARLVQGQSKLLSSGSNGLAGNHVLIDHGNGEYSLYAHLQPGSLRVKAGDMVHAGDVIGKLGSSGNSTEPHLHFQLCDRADALMCAGIPIKFGNIELPYADLPRPVQSGDVVVAQ